MLFEVPRFVLCDQIVQSPREVRKEAVVVTCYDCGESIVWVGHEMIVVDVEGGEVVDSKAVDLRDVVFVTCDGAGGRRTRQSGILGESIESNNA